MEEEFTKIHHGDVFELDEKEVFSATQRTAFRTSRPLKKTFKHSSMILPESKHPVRSIQDLTSHLRASLKMGDLGDYPFVKIGDVRAVPSGIEPNGYHVEVKPRDHKKWVHGKLESKKLEHIYESVHQTPEVEDFIRASRMGEWVTVLGAVNGDSRVYHKVCTVNPHRVTYALINCVEDNPGAIYVTEARTISLLNMTPYALDEGYTFQSSPSWSLSVLDEVRLLEDQLEDVLKRRARNRRKVEIALEAIAIFRMQMEMEESEY